VVTFDGDGHMSVQTDDADRDPERLLVSIDNGRGATTRFGYGLSTDPTMVDAVGARNEPRWLVRTVTVAVTGGPGTVTPAMITTYHYGAPRYGAKPTPTWPRTSWATIR